MQWLVKCLQSTRGTPGSPGAGDLGNSDSVLPGQAGLFTNPEEISDVNKKKYPKKRKHKSKRFFS